MIHYCIRFSPSGALVLKISINISSVLSLMFVFLGVVNSTVTSTSLMLRLFAEKCLVWFNVVLCAYVVDVSVEAFPNSVP